jgi:hypothetical protein
LARPASDLRVHVHGRCQVHDNAVMATPRAGHHHDFTFHQSKRSSWPTTQAKTVQD